MGGGSFCVDRVEMGIGLGGVELTSIARLDDGDEGRKGILRTA